jgi:hypothetical protein
MRFVAAMILSLLTMGLLPTPVCLAQQNDAPKPEQAKTAPIGSGPTDGAAKEPSAKSPPSGAGQAAPPKPEDTWSASEIAAAQKVCKTILRKYNAIATPVPPIKKGRCGDPAPIKLIQIGKRPVSFSPAPTVNCRMVAALGKWIKGGLRPLARKFLGARLREISVMSSYSCRNRYGRPSARLSEHAKANALDIGGFKFDSGDEVRLLANWGPTRRELVARAAAAKAAKTVQVPPTPDSKGGPEVAKPVPPQVPAVANARAPGASPVVLQFRSTQRSAVGQGDGAVFAERFHQIILPPLPQRRPSLKERMRWAQLARRAERRRTADERRRLESYRAKLNKFLYPPNHLGGAKAGLGNASVRRLAAKVTPDRTGFLKAAHRSACRYFGTVLGPEANKAHRNHFHVDLAPRRHKNYCE